MKRSNLFAVTMLVFMAALAFAPLAWGQEPPTNPTEPSTWWFAALGWIKGIFGGKTLWVVPALAGASVVLTQILKVLSGLKGLAFFASGKGAFILSAVIAILTSTAQVIADPEVSVADLVTVLQAVAVWVVAWLAYKPFANPTVAKVNTTITNG